MRDVGEEPEITDSCSTSGPGCSHGPCGRSHRRSSRSVDDHRHHQDHRNHHRIRQRCNHHRSYHPGSSCVRCGRPVRTYSTLGNHHRCSCCRHPGGIREKGVRSGRNGSTTSPWEVPGIHGLFFSNVSEVQSLRASTSTYSSDLGL